MVYYVNEGSVYAIGILFPILCTLAVAARFQARRHKRMEYGADDWMALAALIFTIGCGAMMIAGDALHIIGWHSGGIDLAAQWERLSYRDEMQAKFQLAFNPLSVLAIGCVRLTFALLFRRIFTSRTFSKVNSVVIVLIGAWVVAYFFGELFQCFPHFSAYWTSEEAYAEFCAQPGMDTSMCITDAALDLLIFVLPIYPVWGLQMSVKRRLVVLLVFAMGALSVAACMTKMVLALEILTYPYGSTKHLFGLDGTSDPIGIVSVMLWWTYLELGVGCLISNYPAIGLIRDQIEASSWSSPPWLSLKSMRSTTRSASYSESAHSELHAIKMEVQIDQQSRDYESSIAHSNDF